MARSLEVHEFALETGIVTNFNPETVVGAMETIDNCDSFNEFRSLGKVPGSEIINSNGRMGEVRSVHFFEYTDYDFVNRQKLLAIGQDAGGSNPKLWDITLSTTRANQTKTEVIELDADVGYIGVEMQNRLHLSAPLIERGFNGNEPLNPTGGVKYDGTHATRWGVLGPGLEPVTIRELADNTFDATPTWVGTTGTIQTSLNRRRYLGGYGFTPAAGSTSIELSQTGLGGEDIDPNTTGRAFMWFFVPSGGLLDEPELTITLTDGSVQTFIEQIDSGSLITGWNLVRLDFADLVTAATFDPTDITDIDIKVTWTTTTALREYVVNHLHTTDRSAPSVALGAALLPPNDQPFWDGVGDYRFRCTYFTEYGVESNAGEISSTYTMTDNTPASATLTFGAIPAPGDRILIFDEDGDHREYVFQNAGLTNANEVEIAGTAVESIENLHYAINADFENANKYGPDTQINTFCTSEYVNGATTLTVTVRDGLGTTGNGVVVSSFIAGGTTPHASNIWGAATFTGGVGLDQLKLTLPIAGENSSSTAPTGVIARRVYADFNGDGIFRFVLQVDENSVSTINVNSSSGIVGGGTRGLTTPPLAADEFLDNTPPVSFDTVEVHRDRIYGISSEFPTTLWPSDINGPETFPILNQFVFPRPLVALHSTKAGLLIFSSDRTFQLTGDGTSDFPIEVTEVNSEQGCSGPLAVTAMRGEPFLFHQREAYVASVPRKPWYVSGGIQDSIAAGRMSTSGISKTFIVNDRSRSRVITFGAAAQGGHFRRPFVYQYGTLGFSQITGQGLGTDPQDARTAQWYDMEFPTTVEPLCAVMVERTSEFEELTVGTEEGWIHHVQAPGIDGWQTDPGTQGAGWTDETTEEVVFDIAFHDVPIGGSADGRGEPRFIGFNVVNRNLTSATFDVTFTLRERAGGTSVGSTQTVSVVVVGPESAPIIPIPPMGARSGWLSIDIAKTSGGAVGPGFLIRSMSLYYIPRGSASFRGSRAA